MQGLANTAWAFATAVRSDEELFRTCARAAERRRDEFTGVKVVFIRSEANSRGSFVNVFFG